MMKKEETAKKEETLDGGEVMAGFFMMLILALVIGLGVSYDNYRTSDSKHREECAAAYLLKAVSDKMGATTKEIDDNLLDKCTYYEILKYSTGG